MFQPEELPDNTLMWTQNARPTLYGQWLAWQITIEHSIDPADGVEPVEVIKSGTCFEGKVIVKGKKEALHEATRYRAGLVMWTDGSKLDNGNSGAAVCWRDKRLDRWKQKSVFLGKNKEILDAELWAISDALVIAIRETSNANNTPITIFCDSQKALQAIQHPPSHKENRFLRGQIYHKAKKLQNIGHPVVCRWTPGHSGLEGNKRADLMAKNRAEKGGKQAECWSSLAYIKEILAQAQSRELAKWHEVKTQEREVSRRGFYIPWTKANINPVLGNAPKKYASRYYQLKVGHGAVGTYLARIGVIETPECWWCKETVQSVEHLYTRYRKWRKERRKLVRELEKEGVVWQAQGERRWLASLLGNEKAVAPLLRFLKTTDVGGREGARERELEWERENDQAGEELLE